MRRFLSVFLCLLLLFSFFLSPIRANALVDPAYSAAYVVVGDIVVEGFKEGAKVIASALSSVWNKVFTYDLLQTSQGVLEVGSFFTDTAGHVNVYNSYSEGELSSGQVVLTKAFLSSVAAAYKTKTGLTLSEPTEDVTINVPPEAVWTEAELITAERLNITGFADLTEVNQNILAGNQIVWQLKKDLNGLELYLRTTFVETLGAEFDALLSGFKSSISTLNQNLTAKLTALNTSIGSLETSIDVMSSTLHTDLAQLKSSYASFGNETLDKLDTLNTSIQNITLSDLSTDFVSLRETITQYDSLILTAVQDLPDQISQSLTDFYETQSLQLQDISNKLGNETSFLETLVGDAQLIRDELSNGFADLKVSLDNLDVTASVDLQPLIDQILSSEMTLNDSLNSLYTAIESLEVDMTADFQPVIDQIIESEAILSEPLIYLDQFNWDVIHPSLESILSSFGSVQTSLDSINDQVLYGLDTSIGALRAALTNEFSFLKLRITELFSSLDKSLTTQLTDIKTAVQSVSGEVAALKSDVVGELQGIKTTIDRLVPESVVVSKPAVDVQVGAQTIVVSDYATAGQAFGAKLGWLHDLFDFLRELFNRITYTDEAPKVALNLSDTEGSYDLGVDTLMIDLSWYSRFKPTVDLLLSGILWITFCMHAYRRAPDILSGVGASVVTTGSSNNRKSKER